jgi:uncharacterized protein with von Willebrand factor type A (vWA) domain
MGTPAPEGRGHATPGRDRPDEAIRPDRAFLEHLVGFGRYVRSKGLPVGTGRTLTFCRAAAALDPFDRDQLRRAARISLVSRPEDFSRLDALFDRYFGTGQPGGAIPGAAFAEPGPAPDGEGSGRHRDGAEDDQDEQPVVPSLTWSPTAEDEDADDRATVRLIASGAEVLRGKDFAKLSTEERRTMLRAVRRLVMEAPRRRSRRHRPTSHSGRLDMRRTLRASLRTEGEPLRRAWRDRRTRPRPLVLILDVSGSMAPYSRPLLEFAHAAVAAGRRVEVFVFGTRLTRITRLVRSRDPDAALEAVGASVVDWEGGTRIGESLKQLLDTWASRSALRGSVVILASDGLERGDPELLSAQIQRLSRLVHSVVWVNPLKGSPRYEPLARGMAAALPHIDVFLPGHNLESLEALVATVASE